MLRTAKTENGIVRGLPAADPRITSYKGIPFAAPPVGEYRFHAPMPAKDWEGELKAFEFAPISMQAPTVIDVNNIYTREWAVDPDIPMSEDCLYLNVWTPACSAEEKLPVYVWYFGGGLQVGHTAEMEFDGERIARRGIVVVTVNYRLNVFGFLCHPEITSENPQAPANFGYLDQQAATRWVKRNIAAFGGDPTNITIGGQSAGGGSVLSQLTSPQNEGLFQRAIVQSGFFGVVYPEAFNPFSGKTLSEAEQEGVEFFKFLGVESLQAARGLEAEYINKKALEYKHFWGPAVDNIYCIGDSLELFVSNKRLPVPVMAGHTSQEFIQWMKAESMEEFEKTAIDCYGDRAHEFLRICKAEDDDVKTAVEKSGIRGIEYAIRIAANANSKTGINTPFYYYNFDAEIPGWDNPGTFHSVDLWFFFETLAKCWRPFTGKHYDLARQMCNYWSNFIKTGNPNGIDSTGEELPLWEPYTEENPYGMVFGDKAEFAKEEPGELVSFLVKEYYNKK
ncbi:carboxylesterase/lipase family protein [Anaerocolumna chitinilytica]|uniref:Carboxylic ester hydrolase n=1 Tax=Anaerocolumna chitinilytica TaxID=1727145 RepID=A0A7I8DHD3_9FIRM|nr:carboxylesterase family protein [Anaerocolumna chitinilytica]BCJ97903.1 carboxylic ester hydrolase [Anaerocolumna chitinilytica]